MESIARPMRRLQEEASWFARAHELKLMHVHADATLRGPALDLLMSQENHADNRALFFRFDDPTGPAGAWGDRAARLRAQWQEKTDAIAPAGIQLAPLGTDGARSGGGEFAALLSHAKASLAPPLTQVVVVLAPARVEHGDTFLAEVTALVSARELGHVRWIVVEVDGAAVAPLVGRLGAGTAALGCLCQVDPQAQQDELAAQGARGPFIDSPSHAAPDGAVPAWRAPGAMPDVAPPPRKDQRRPATDAELRAVGLSPRFVNGGGVALKQLILGAALALREGRHTDAITLQARAAALCAELEMPREQVLNLHVLGGYLIAAQARPRAREVYQRANERAQGGGFADLQSQGELALGMLDALDRRPAEAAAHYSAAGRLAEEAGSEALAIECWRLAGQLALEARLEQSAVECWKRALSLAEPLDPKVAQLTSAAEIARALAALCRKRGLTAQAQSLDQQSIALEQGS